MLDSDGKASDDSAGSTELDEVWNSNEDSSARKPMAHGVEEPGGYPADIPSSANDGALARQRSP